MKTALTRIILAAALAAGLSTAAFAHEETNPELQSYDFLRHTIEAKGAGPSSRAVAILDSNPETATYTWLRAAQTLPPGQGGRAAIGVAGPMRDHDGANTN